MALQQGTRLGAYEILSPLGAGGMGEVYRARDTKLQRDVALKILPDTMARDAQRMARFEREAQVLASLNHPNIAAIYGLEESNGIRALVMELVEGQTLAERISVAAGFSPAQSQNAGLKAAATTAEHRSGVGEGSTLTRGPKGLPYDDALPIAKQIAEALEYAHERGVIHRDLKPANVKITPEGTVKVLDFGLAKVLDTQDSTTTMDIANSPTLSAMATQAGMILGTAAYMSPEQAKGQRVDRRADIWAFGCVLFEMLTGQKPFEGETISDVLAAVIRAEPEWKAIPETIPPSIQLLIRRCLIKDPKQRLRDIGDARIAIDETTSSTGVSPVVDHGQDAHATTGTPGSPLRRFLPWALAAVGFLLAAVFIAAYFLKSPAAQVESIRAHISPPEKVLFAFDQPSGAPILSPDGTRLVFPGRDASAKESLWVRPLDSLIAQHLQGTEGATFPFWAPDSRQVGFFQDGKLKKIDVTGGPPILVCDAPGARGGAWSTNGVIVFAPQSAATAFAHGGGLMDVPAAGGTPTPIATHTGKGNVFSNRWPVFLPDGRHFIYLSGDLGATGTSKLGIYIGKLGSHEARFLLQADSDALYAPPGYLLFLRGNTLMAQRFNAGNQKLDGEPFPVAENVASPREFRLGLFSVSRTGFLILATTSSGDVGGQLVWLDESGKQVGVGPTSVQGLRLSPDGKRVAYFSGSLSTLTGDIWLKDLARGVQTRLTFGPKINFDPVWSPDGSRIAYASLRKSGDLDIFAKDSSGAGNGKLLLASEKITVPTDWSHDGRYILFTSQKPPGKPNVWALPLFGDHKPFPYIQGQFATAGAVFSPDGHWVAYMSDESGSNEVYVSPFPPGGGKWQVSQGGGGSPQWSRDGTKLYYLAPGGKLMETSVRENRSAVELGTPRQLFHESLVNGQIGGEQYAVAPGGKRFLVVRASQAASPPLTLVTNWTATLKKH